MSLDVLWLDIISVALILFMFVALPVGLEIRERRERRYWESVYERKAREEQESE